MPLLSASSFRRELASRAIPDLLEDYVFGGPTFIFRANPSAEVALKDHVARRLGVSAAGIFVVGSAKTGFSLDPAKFPKPFSRFSDLDLVVIDTVLFDNIWSMILRWNQPRRQEKLPKSDSDWARQRRREIYWGCFERIDRIGRPGLSLVPELKPLRDISYLWFSTFQTAAALPLLAGRQVSARLYRTREHADLYQGESLRRIRASLGSAIGGR